MTQPLSLPADKKLVVTYRVEPGCLGPDGKNKIVDFCSFAQQQFQSLDADYIVWNIVPRDDKSLPEMQFDVVGKRMNHAQADKYLSLVGKNLDEFETHLGEKLAELINQYMGQ
ncbi:hypothetical protein [Oceanicoccus sp. KOV_DT_Chl]|uniref:hypothetical protein n=1 Tax=Oceanicoccus sp. KOV_DT_Chl TaxID=1904639 RepID=UPI000C7D7BC4|nr:hypothetical protein [Oceanicoccus sp. KOV_DT_Chl]